MALKFITGNANKFAEAKQFVPNLERLDIDLPEVQSNDPCEIIQAKLEEATKHHAGELIVEDTSLFFDCMHGLPGPLVKWFLQAMGHDGLYALAKSKGDCGAEARAVIGYAHNGVVEFFEGSVHGTIVAPRGDSDFGWDPIFQPDGSKKTFAEMTMEEKNAASHRTKALEKFTAYLAHKTEPDASCTLRKDT